MANYEHTIWPAYEQFVQHKGAFAPETIAALYSIFVLERQKKKEKPTRDQGDSSKRFRAVVEQTLWAIPDDGALALAHGEAHMQWAVANMPEQNNDLELFEVYMQDAVATAMSRQKTTLYELSEMRAWLVEQEGEVQ